MSGKVSFAPRVQSTGQDLKLSMQKLWLTGQVLTVGARLWIRHEFVSQESQPVEVIYGFMFTARRLCASFSSERCGFPRGF